MDNENQKNILCNVRGGFVTDNRNGKWFSIEVEDSKSRCMILEVEIESEDFYDLLASRGVYNCKAKLNQVFDFCGKKRINDSVKVYDDRLRKYEWSEDDIKDIINDKCADLIDDGWFIKIPSHTCLRHGQCNTAEGSLFIDIYKFVDPD